MFDVQDEELDKIIEQKQELTTDTETQSLPKVDIETLQNEYLQKQVKDGKSLEDLTNDLFLANINKDIINDTTKEGKQFNASAKKKQREVLSNKIEQKKVESEGEIIDAKTKKAESMYKAFRPILEFDLSHLIHNNKTHEVHEYSDRSYGCLTMSVMLIFLTIPYFITTLILAIFNGINAILEEINTFGKIAKYIVLSLVVIASAVLIVYAAICGVEKLFSINIIHH